MTAVGAIAYFDDRMDCSLAIRSKGCTMNPEVRNCPNVTPHGWTDLILTGPGRGISSIGVDFLFSARPKEITKLWLLMMYPSGGGFVIDLSLSSPTKNECM